MVRALAVLLLTAPLGPLGVVAYVDGPELGFDNPLNEPSGSLTLGGIPEACSAGRGYEFTILLSRTGVSRGGFQLEARFASGQQRGRQAGSLEPIDERVEVVEGNAGRVHYAQHTESGSLSSSEDSMRWTVRWGGSAELGFTRGIPRCRQRIE